MMQTAAELFHYIREPDFLFGVIVGIILVLLVMLLGSLRRRPQQFEAFSGEQGSVRVTSQALRELVQRYCEEMPEVGRARAIIRVKGKLLTIQIRLRIRSDARLVGVSGYLQEQIGGIVRKNLGMENIGPVDVVVVGILPASKPQHGRRKDKPEEIGETSP